MVAEEDRGAGGTVVFVVAEADGGADGGGREAEEFPAQPAAVGVIGGEEGEGGAEGQKEGLHRLNGVRGLGNLYAGRIRFVKLDQKHPFFMDGRAGNLILGLPQLLTL